jgi:hypothetical protein
MEVPGKALFEGGLLHISTAVEDGHAVLEFIIVLTEVLVALSELVELSRCSSHFLRVTKSSFKHHDKYLHILEVVLSVRI